MGGGSGDIRPLSLLESLEGLVRLLCGRCCVQRRGVHMLRTCVRVPQVGVGRESVRRALRARQALASPMICLFYLWIPHAAWCHSFTLVDKGLPESAPEMCGYLREEGSRAIRLHRRSMYARVNFVPCECPVYVRFASKCAPRARRISLFWGGVLHGADPCPRRVRFCRRGLARGW